RRRRGLRRSVSFLETIPCQGRHGAAGFPEAACENGFFTAETRRRGEGIRMEGENTESSNVLYESFLPSFLRRSPRLRVSAVKKTYVARSSSARELSSSDLRPAIVN